jgi:ABC-2 type transport system permease protein
LPITLWQAVAGKFLAAWCFAGIALLLTFPVWITVNYLGIPTTAPSSPPISAASDGGRFSRHRHVPVRGHRNQVIAFITAALVGFVFLLAGFPWCSTFVRGPAAGASSMHRLIEIFTHFDAISKGVIDLRDLVYFAALIGFWLAATALCST